MIILPSVINIFIATSIFFVWVIRYDNIILEFKEFNLPNWIRDLTGIIKLSFAAMLVIGGPDAHLKLLGALGIDGMRSGSASTNWDRKISQVAIPSSSGLIISFCILQCE